MSSPTGNQVRRSKRRRAVWISIAALIIACHIAAFVYYNDQIQAWYRVRVYFQEFGKPAPHTYKYEDILSLGDAARPYIEKWVTDPDTDVRFDAIVMLLKRRDPRSVPALLSNLHYQLDSLDSYDSHEFDVVLDILLQFGDPRAIIPLYEAGFAKRNSCLKQHARMIARMNGYRWLCNSLAASHSEAERAFVISRFKHIYALKIVPYFLKEMQSQHDERRRWGKSIVALLCNAIIDGPEDESFKSFSKWWQAHEHLYRDEASLLKMLQPNLATEKD